MNVLSHDVRIFIVGERRFSNPAHTSEAQILNQHAHMSMRPVRENERPTHSTILSPLKN